MKRLVLFILVFWGFSLVSQAQRSKVISVFQLIETSRFDEAKKAIEEAITDKKTMEWPRTWYARGLLCQVANDKKKPNLYPDQLYVAFDSYEKALSLDTRGRMDGKIAPSYTRLANDFQKLGEKHYNSRKYKDALKAFEHALYINQSPVMSVLIDTNLVYNTALAAYESKEWDKAIDYLSQLHEGNYSTNATHLLFAAYIEKRDTVSAERVLVEGIDRYNDDEDLVLLLVDLLYKTNNAERAVTKLDSVFSRNPSRYIFPYTKGLVYQKTGKYQNAIDAYDDAIKLTQDEFNIYTNLGTCYYNIGVEIEENARTITNNSAFLEEKTKAAAAFESAVSCLEKAHEKNPKDQKVIAKLYQLYKVLGITDKIKNMEKLIE